MINVAAPVISTIFPQAAPAIKTVAGVADTGIAAIQKNRATKKAKAQPTDNKKLITANAQKIKSLENTVKRLSAAKLK